jgi:hypothetical protein
MSPTDVEIPDVHCVRSGDVSVAYQVVGRGRPDGKVAGLELTWRGERELKGVPGTRRLYAVS